MFLKKNRRNKNGREFTYTLRSDRLRAHAPGLTPRELLSKFAPMQMIDGRELVMSPKDSHNTRPDPVVKTREREPCKIGDP